VIVKPLELLLLQVDRVVHCMELKMRVVNWRTISDY